MAIHKLFIICQYGISVLDRAGAATQTTEYFYTPSSSNPSIRKSLGTATGAFSIACFFIHLRKEYILQVIGVGEP